MLQDLPEDEPGGERAGQDDDHHQQEERAAGARTGRSGSDRQVAGTRCLPPL
jgi:hypothetical protein